MIYQDVMHCKLPVVRCTPSNASVTIHVADVGSTIYALLVSTVQALHSMMKHVAI
jgi:hypothetical protein